MKEHDIRVEIHRILDSHDAMLASVHDGQSALQRAFAAHDAVLVSAIEANRAALRLLNRIMDEGVEHDG
jgi:nucleoside-triphosphatase THEP1